MKFIIALALLAVALAAPQGYVKPIEIVSSQSERNADGSYSFFYENTDGTHVFESGNPKLLGPQPGNIGSVSRGNYSYISPDGVRHTVNWVADENGFQANRSELSPPQP